MFTSSNSRTPSRARPAISGERGASSSAARGTDSRNADFRDSRARISLPSDGRRGNTAGGRPSFSGRNAQQGRTGAQAGKSRAERQKQYIHPSRFIQEATISEKAEFVAVHTFADFKLHAKILANVTAKGYLQPSPIQDKTIPLVLEGKDVVGIANTGTGKTAAFALPMINDLIKNMDHRVLIMAPTRELAQQIQEECLMFSKGCGFRTALLIGGASMNIQVRDLRQNPRIIIGTPGRIKDHLQQKTLNLSNITFTVLDEFDRMLDMGFIRDITDIFSRVPANRQSLFFSATMENGIEAQIRKFSKDPVTISVKEGVTADSVKQDVVFFTAKDSKIDLLHDLLIEKERGKTIIFDDTKRSVEKLGRELTARGFRVDQIHGNKSQAQRSRAIKRLKTNEIDILVATDVAARGIDVSDISHVINYSQPNTYEDYVHRIGRTGRAGKTGLALTFVQK